MNDSPKLEVLEVGGGTGSFARAFIKQAASLNATGVNYHILDLSPALMENQRKILSELLPESRHFQQDATEFDLPGHTFDLIISNEVIADFPVASVQREQLAMSSREKALTTSTSMIFRPRMLPIPS